MCAISNERSLFTTFWIRPVHFFLRTAWRVTQGHDRLGKNFGKVLFLLKIDTILASSG